MLFHAPKLLTKKIVLIDGIARTGKILTGSLISSFKNSEHLEFGEIFENLCPGIANKNININFARALIATQLNELIYSKYLSRKVNFRSLDATGVQNSIDFKTYKKRLRVKEGDNIIELIKKENKQIPFLTHNLMVNINFLNKLNINYKMIELFRNPINIVMSWYNKNWDSRFGRDQRAFTLLINKNNKIFPWFKRPINHNTLPSNAIEKCIDYVDTLTVKSILNFKKLKAYEKKRIFITTYEKITENTNTEIKKISNFLNLKTTKFKSRFCKIKKLPKKSSENKTDQNRFFIRSNVSNYYYKKIISLEKNFNNKVYNLAKI